MAQGKQPCLYYVCVSTLPNYNVDFLQNLQWDSKLDNGTDSEKRMVMSRSQQGLVETLCQSLCGSVGGLRETMGMEFCDVRPWSRMCLANHIRKLARSGAQPCRHCTVRLTVVASLVFCPFLSVTQIHTIFIVIIFSQCVSYRASCHGDEILPGFRLNDAGCCPVSLLWIKQSLPGPSCSKSTFSGNVEIS